MNEQPSDTGVAQRIAATVREDNRAHWSVDRRVPLATIALFVMGGLATAGGYLWIGGGLNQSFANVVAESAAHETRIRGLEVDLGQTNNDVASMKGQFKGFDDKLDELLKILRPAAYTPAPPHRNP